MRCSGVLVVLIWVKWVRGTWMFGESGVINGRERLLTSVDKQGA